MQGNSHKVYFDELKYDLCNVALSYMYHKSQESIC